MMTLDELSRSIDDHGLGEAIARCEPADWPRHARVVLANLQMALEHFDEMMATHEHAKEADENEVRRALDGILP